MSQKSRLSLEVRKVILGHLRERLDAKAISISSVMNTVHRALPHCDLTDSELTNVIAETAIEAGFGVNFDSRNRH